MKNRPKPTSKAEAPKFKSALNAEAPDLCVIMNAPK
jgi:hypothetical protein